MLQILAALDVVGLAIGRLELERKRELGQLRFAELDVDLASLGDPQRGVARFGDFAEESTHLERRFEIVLVAAELETIGIAHERARLYAQQRVVGDGVAAVHVVTVVGRE